MTMKKLKKKISLLLWVAFFSMVLALAGCSKYTDHPEPAPAEQELQVFSAETEWTMGTESLVQNSEATESGEAETTGSEIAQEASEALPPDPFTTGTQFRNNDRFEEHYQKHVIDQQEFGGITREEYMTLAQALVDTPGPNVQSKQNSDGDTLYYDAETNSFAVVSPDGFIRTFFKPGAGQSYYDRQK